MKKIILLTIIFAVLIQSTVFAFDIFTVGKNFINQGTSAGQVMENTIKNENIIIPIFNLILGIGVIIAVVVGIVIAVKLMTGGVDAKADMKGLLTPYIISVIVLVSAWTIWKIALNFLQGTFN